MSTIAATRKRRIVEVPETAQESTALQAILTEMRGMRQEQTRREEDFAAALRQRDAELERLQQQIQLSRSTNLSAAEPESGGSDLCGARVALGYKLKPDTFDGSVSLREFFSQFELIARANRWDDATRTVALASCLRGKARSVLEAVEDLGSVDFAELKSKLELRFGEGHLSQNHYASFTNRKQKFGEDLAALGSELERLSRLAYPECPYAVRDKIACAQFVSALTDNFIRRTLQLEGVTSLKAAVERAKAIKIIQGEDFERGREGYNGNKFGRRFAEGEKGANQGQGSEKKEPRKAFAQKGQGQRDKFGSGPRECWTCGKSGHFRAECPENKGNGA